MRSGELYWTVNGVLDLGPSGYRNDHKKKADRFPCRKSDLFSEFHAWKNTYLKEGKKGPTQQNVAHLDASTEEDGGS